MNRLELAKRLKTEAGVAGTLSTTIGQTGEFGRLVDWLDAAWTEIQSGHKWDFLWEAATVTITAATNETAGSIAAHRYVQDGTFQSTTPITYLPWAMFRERFPAALVAEGTPNAWTIRPDKAFVVNAKPSTDTAYSVERYANPVAMTADEDEPALAAEHHLLIVWAALMLYAQHEEAGSLYATAKVNRDRMMTALGLLELPDMTFGDPLC